MCHSSIRARVTLGFVLAALPVLILVCGIYLGIRIRMAETLDARSLQRITERAARRLSRGNPAAALLELASDPEIRSRGITILLLDGRGRTLGQTPGALPLWPWPAVIQDPAVLESLVSHSSMPTIGPPWRSGSVSPPRLPRLPSSRRASPASHRTTHVLRQEPMLAEVIHNADPQWMIARARLSSSRIVIAARMRTSALAAQKGRARELFAVCGVFLLIVALGAWVLVGRVLSPIGRLADQAAAASSHDFQVSLEAPSRDVEIVHLVHTLNGLLTRVAQTAASRAQFYAAASHELRTPLQALSGHLEVALTHDRSALEYREALVEAYTQTRRLARLTTDLLMLNRLDSAMPERKETVDLRSVVETTAQEHRDQIQCRRLNYTGELDHTITLLAPPLHVQIVVRNLVENAVKYATPGRGLRVTLVPGTIPRLEIENDCGWDPAVDCARLFEPFYRPDASRSASTGGNGLGLSICQAIAKANGWHVRLEPTSTGVHAIVEFAAPVA